MSPGPQEAKEVLIERYLRFIESFGPLNEARIGILGGDGLELQVQERFGVTASNSWVVESHKGRSLKLLRSWRGHRHSPMDVRVFPQALESFYGFQPYFDAFHWDFYETVETNFSSIVPLVPCLARSPRGGVLAVTVSDARANRTLEHPEVVSGLMKQLLGSDGHDAFLRWLIEEKAGIPRGGMPERFQAADPVKGALKEMSMFIHLLGAISQPYFKHHPALPDRMERYVVISRTTGRSHRMRSYFMHLAPERESAGMQQEEIIRAFLNVWRGSPLVHINGLGGVSEVPKPSAEAQRGVGSVKQTKSLEFHERFPKISGIVGMFGSDEMQKELDELTQLIKDSAGAVEEVQRLRDGLQALLGDVSQQVARGKSVTTKVVKERGDAAVTSPANGTARVTSTRSNRSDDSITRVMGQVQMLVAFPKGEEALEEAKHLVQKDLGITRKKNRDRTTGALFARTHGKFLPKFCRRVSAVLGPDECRKVLPKIHPAIVKLDGEAVTLERLMKEAGISV